MTRTLKTSVIKLTELVAWLGLLSLTACAHAPHPSTLPAIDAQEVLSDTTYAEACGLRRGEREIDSHWVKLQPDGSLRYVMLPSGDHVLDFSSAGYMGGGVEIPKLMPVRTLTPSGGDDTAAIQGALDAVAALPLIDGARGAVWLAPGVYRVSQMLVLRASGVVLRGSGANPRGTTLLLIGEPRTAISLSGEGTWLPTGVGASIVDDYVPASARSVHVDDPSDFGIGDSVLVLRPITSAWVRFMNMDTLRRRGLPQTWLGTSRVMRIDRVVTGVIGNQVTLDAPIADSIDRRYVAPPGARLMRYTFDGRIDRVGVESLRMVAPKRPTAISQPMFRALSLNALTNGFVRDLVLEEFTAGITIAAAAKWVTVQDVTLTRSAAIDGKSGYPAMFSVSGQQTLVQRCRTIGDSAFAYTTQSLTPGPNVVLGLHAEGSGNGLQPHQRWATALLVDNVDVSSGIDLMNRGMLGSGHGWTMGFGVVWNSQTTRLTVQYPPGAPNWAIGSAGEIKERAAPGGSTLLPLGIVEAVGTRVSPFSLYLAQLCLRLGPQAPKNIGYPQLTSP